MAKKYIGLAMSDSMFSGEVTLHREPISVDDVRAMTDGDVEICCNPSHQASLDALEAKYGVKLVVPETPPKVALGDGDELVVMQIRGLPRLTDRHEYTTEEVERATFTFARYTVSAS